MKAYTVATPLHRQVKEQLREQLVTCLAGTRTLEAGEFLGVDPSRISRIRHAALTQFSTDWLVDALGLCGYDIEISLTPRQRAPTTLPRPTATVQRYDRDGQPV